MRRTSLTLCGEDKQQRCSTKGMNVPDEGHLPKTSRKASSTQVRLAIMTNNKQMTHEPLHIHHKRHTLLGCYAPSLGCSETLCVVASCLVGVSFVRCIKLLTQPHHHVGRDSKNQALHHERATDQGRGDGHEHKTDAGEVKGVF